MPQPNVSEDLVEECGKQHPDDVFMIRADRYKELDSSGIDLLIDFKIRLGNRRETALFPMALKMQVKTSDNLQTIGVILPVSGKFLAKNSEKISRKMRWRIKKHLRLHPSVTCMLFVSQLRDGKTRELVMEEIWRELSAIRRYLARHYFRLLER